MCIPRDRASNTTALVSISLDGSGGGKGRYSPGLGFLRPKWPVCAVQERRQQYLVAGDSNNVSDVFVRDMVNGTTVLVSVNTNGLSGNGVSRSAAMTPDSHYVVFVSAANDLVPGDGTAFPMFSCATFGLLKRLL